MGAFFHTYLYVPIYNLLVFLISVVPGADIGLAIVLATLIVKVLLLPLSLSAARTQKAMKAIEPELKSIREKYKDDKEKQAREMFALYAKYGIKPFSSILSIFIQLPIIIALYWVFNTKSFPTIDLTLLYPFVHEPLAVASTMFLGGSRPTLPANPLWPDNSPAGIAPAGPARTPGAGRVACCR
jgi:YidC/Oxa1 family membrane protein insertase